MNVTTTNRLRTSAAMLCCLLATMCLRGCATGPRQEQENQSTFTLEESVETIISHIERGRDCGDTTTPLLSAEEIEAAINDEFAATDGDQTLEEFVLEWVQRFSDRADVHCGVVSNVNDNAGTEENTNAD